MKPSLRQFRERIGMISEEKKAQIKAAAQSHAIAKKFERDKALVNWWDRNCMGHTTSEVQKIIHRGVIVKEISYEQGLLLLNFLTDQGYLAA